MEHIRLFENYKSDEEIHKICERYNIIDYTINKDGSIDVDGDVILSYKDLNKLPLTFNVVNGNFNCNWNNLTDLIGSPRIITGGFYCLGNNLTNLIGGPDEVGDWSVWNNKQLTSLEGIAKIINGSLDIISCSLSDFKGIPEDFYIGGKIHFIYNSVYDNLEKFLRKYDINIKDIENKYLDLILEINELDAIQDGKIIDMRMDEVLYNVGLI